MIGAHLSLIFCQIQYLAVDPSIHAFIMLVTFPGVSCWIFDLMDFIHNSVALSMIVVAQPPQPVVRQLNILRRKRWAYRCHTKFKSRHRPGRMWTHFESITKTQNGHPKWASLREPLSHWIDLFSCFQIPPRIDTWVEEIGN